MVRGTKTELPDMATCGGKIHDSIFFCVRFEQSTVATYGGKFMTTYFFAYDMSNQLWLIIAGYLNYLSSTYVFISSFVSLTKYEGRKLNTLMWLRIAGYLNYLSSTYVFYFFFRFTDKLCGTKTENCDVAMYGGNLCLHIFSHTVIWLMSHRLTVNNRPGFL